MDRRETQRRHMGIQEMADQAVTQGQRIPIVKGQAKPYVWLIQPWHLPPWVTVHRNLKRTSPSGGPVYSVADSQSGLVIVHTSHIWLEEAVPQIQPAGQKRARVTGIRNVHAKIKGRPGLPGDMDGNWVEYTYSPMDGVDGFHVRHGEGIWEGPSTVVLGPRGLVVDEDS